MSQGSIHIIGAPNGSGGWRLLDDQGRLTLEQTGAGACCEGGEWEPYGAICTFILPLLWPCATVIDDCIQINTQNVLPTFAPTTDIFPSYGFTGNLVSAVAVRDTVADPMAQAISYLDGEAQPIEDVCEGMPTGFATFPIAFGIGRYPSASVFGCAFLNAPDAPLEFRAHYYLVWYAQRYSDDVIPGIGLVCCPEAGSCAALHDSEIGDYRRYLYHGSEGDPDYIIYGMTELSATMIAPPIAPWPSGGMPDPASNIIWDEAVVMFSMPCPEFEEMRPQRVYGGQTNCSTIRLPQNTIMGGAVFGTGSAWPYLESPYFGRYRFRKQIDLEAHWSGYVESDLQPPACVNEVGDPSEWNLSAQTQGNVDLDVTNIWGAAP